MQTYIKLISSQSLTNCPPLSKVWLLVREKGGPTIYTYVNKLHRYEVLFYLLIDIVFAKNTGHMAMVGVDILGTDTGHMTAVGVDTGNIL